MQFLVYSETWRWELKTKFLTYFMTIGIAVLHNVTCTICNGLDCGKVQKSQLFLTCVKS